VAGRSKEALNGSPGGKHRAQVSRWRRLALFVGGVFHSQQRQCRAGHHRYADPTPIGGGILRYACAACGNISLDLREANSPVSPALFIRNDELRTFSILRRYTLRHM
jgi:hypothetical protein